MESTTPTVPTSIDIQIEDDSSVDMLRHYYSYDSVAFYGIGTDKKIDVGVFNKAIKELKKKGPEMFEREYECIIGDKPSDYILFFRYLVFGELKPSTKVVVTPIEKGWLPCHYYGEEVFKPGQMSRDMLLGCSL